MKTELLKYRSEIEELGIDFLEVCAEVDANKDDFEVDNYRFIRAECIDDIQKEELSDDEYILGFFRSYFIADTCDIDIEVVEALQKAEAYEALGRLMLKNGIDELQEEYARQDGYGHHFAHYDHETHEIGEYYAFRVN